MCQQSGSFLSDEVSVSRQFVTNQHPTPLFTLTIFNYEIIWNFANSKPIFTSINIKIGNSELKLISKFLSYNRNTKRIFNAI